MAGLAAVGALPPPPAESIDLADAAGRVTAAPVWARISNPSYHAAAMDGVAVRAAATVGARETAPKTLRIGGDATWIDTGDPLPPEMDAVVMIEDVHDRGDGSIEILSAVAPWQHVRPLGEDIVATELVVPQGHQLRPVDLGAIAAAGHHQVLVRRKPRLALIPTGTELVEVGTRPKPGQIIEFNSLMLAAMAEAWGADATRRPIQPDSFDGLRREVSAALDEADIVVINAGSSAGSADFTARVVEDLGELLVHGIAIRPGHPVVLGVARDRPLIGIPGYPVSAALTFELLVAPLVQAKLGRAAPAPSTIRARIARKVVSPMGEDEFLRVKLGKVGDRLIAAPLERGAGVIMSLVRADGIARIPRFSEGLAAGSEVEVQLLRDVGAIERTVVAIGSHDPALDLLANEVSRRFAPAALASTNVGSYGGLLALRRGEAHVAGCHLLDPTSGAYNVREVRAVLTGRRVVLVNFAHRVQGLIVPAGNPKRIQAIEDLTREDVRFVNRQRGSGTRMLLDYELDTRGLRSSEVRGYEREQYTHLSVAADVASGTADTGLGVLAAARALELEFVPLLTERYDLVIPREHYESDVLRPVLTVLADPVFARAVEALGGYDVGEMGKIVAEVEG
jgi:putative molybdopterin biosynthesis protein